MHAQTKPQQDSPFPFSIAPSADSPNACAYGNDQAGVWLYQANCLEFMDALIGQYPDGVFDMIFADPPYFLSNGGTTCQSGKLVKVDKGAWDKSQGAELNHEFNREWLSRCQKLLKPHGTLWVSGTQHVIYSVGFAMQQLGMRILNDITWEKLNPPPNLSCRFFTHSTETILWAAKNDRAKHRFNYDAMREINDGKQMKTVWRFGVPKKIERAFGKHPTQKPVALLERIILSCTEPGDLVFDPFAGSASTGIAALAQKRQFVGCELDADWVAASAQRLEEELEKGRLPPLFR